MGKEGSAEMNVFIRADASVKIGTGHIIRCLTLAKELKKRGAHLEFVCREHPGNLIEFLSERNEFTVHSLSELDREEEFSYLEHSSLLGSDWLSDAEEVERILRDFVKKRGKIHWLLIDHYGIDEKWQNHLRPLVQNIFVIDDLADRPHNCSILLDQNYCPPTEIYKKLVPSNCELLLGPRYALLRKQFSQARKNLRTCNGEIKSILVFLGGSDPTNETGLILEAIQNLNRADLTIEIIVGISNPHRQKIKEQAALINNVIIHHYVDEMAELMGKVNLFIGAGGTTTWERCCLGLPSLVISIAKNQEVIAENLDRDGQHCFLGKTGEVTSERVKEVLLKLLKSPEKVVNLSNRSLSLVDGMGTTRVVEKMFSVSKNTAKER